MGIDLNLLRQMDPLAPALLGFLQPAGEPFELHEFSEEEWQRLLKMADWWKITPLLSQRLLRDKPAQPVPAWAARAIQQRYYACRAANLASGEALKQALAALQQVGIRMAPLKGIYLAQFVYGDIGLRAMLDLDLWVAPRDVPQAISVLAGLGYTLTGRFEAQGPLPPVKHAPALRKPGLPLLELHWNLVDPGTPLRLDETEVWRRAAPIPQGRTQALALAPEDLVLYLGVHAAYGHKFNNQLRSLVDIAEAAARFAPVLDWDLVARRALQWNAGRGAWLAFSLARSFLAAQVPESALAPLPAGEAYLALAAGHVLRTAPVPPAKLSQALRSRSPGQRFTSILKGMFPARAVIGERYALPPGSARVALHYPRYWMDKAARHWRFTRRIVAGDPGLLAEVDSQLSLADWLSR